MSTNNSNRNAQSRSGSNSQVNRQKSQQPRQRTSSGSGSGSNQRQPQSTQRTRSGKKPQRKRSKWKIVRNIILILLLVIMFAIAGAAIGAYLGIIKNAPHLEALSVKPGTYTSIMVSDTTGEEIARFSGDEDRIYVPLDEISVDMQNAVIAIEDVRFRSHNGVDIKGTIRSIYQTALQGSTQGGSTITQQVIKNYRGLIRNDWITKLQEQYLAVKFEKDLTKELGSKQAAKDHILELYLNTIYFGHGLNGVQTTANYYFDKDAKDLTLAESCVIASITQNPSYYSPDSHPENNVKRATTTLNYMLDAGLISQSEYTQAYNDLQGPVYEEIKNSAKTVQEKENNFSYFTDQVLTELTNDLIELGYSESAAADKIYRGGITIYATQDMEIQNVVDEAMLDDSNWNSKDYRIEVTYKYDIQDPITGEVKHEDEKDQFKTSEECDAFVEKTKANLAAQGIVPIAEKVEKVPQPQASFVLLENGTGRVLAMSGGRGEKSGNRVFNRATHATRQPGSVFKVLAAFAPAIDTQKANASTVFDDVPSVMQDGHQFGNWYKQYRGLSTIRDGVRDSMNIIAVKTMQLVGINTSIEYLENFGFTTLVTSGAKNDLNLSTALGGITKGVSNMETTTAFSAIANGGTYVKPIYYTKVYDHDGNLLIDNTTPTTHQVLSPQAAYIVTDMMYDVVYGGGTGSAAKLPNNMPVAAKTGTTSDVKDLCFIGYSPYFTAGIFMGYDTPMKMNNSSKEHQKVWAHIMAKAHEIRNLPVKQFENPGGIVPATVCSESGELATDLCSRDRRGSTAYTEMFISGTQPTTSCSVHQEFKMDSSTGKIANDYCPAASIVSKVGIVRPIPFESDNPANYPADREYEIIPSNICTVHGPDNNGNLPVEPETPADDDPILPPTDDDNSTPEYINNGNNGGTSGSSNLLPPVTDPNANNNSNNTNNSNNNTNGGTNTNSNTVKPTPPPETVPEFVDPLTR